MLTLWITSQIQPYLPLETVFEIAELTSMQLVKSPETVAIARGGKGDSATLVIDRFTVLASDDQHGWVVWHTNNPQTNNYPIRIVLDRWGLAKQMPTEIAEIISSAAFQ
ncbi:MAG: hypothetical protein QNL16_14035 [Rhodobacterales bacterium]